MQTSEQLMSDLLDKAKSGKHLQFQFLRNWVEYSRSRKLLCSYILLVDSLYTSANRLLNKYCKTVREGTSDVNMILAYCALLNVIRYYEEEAKIVTDMITEYKAYLSYGKLVYSFFGYQRPEEDLWDYRRL